MGEDALRDLFFKVLLNPSDQRAVDEVFRYFIIHNMYSRYIDIDKILYDALALNDFRCLKQLAVVEKKYRIAINTNEDLKDSSSKDLNKSLLFSEMGKLQIRKTIEDYIIDNASIEMKEKLTQLYNTFVEKEKKDGSD